MQVVVVLFAVGLISLIVALASNHPGPGYLSVACAVVTLTLLALWPRLAARPAGRSDRQPAQRSISSQTGVRSDSSW
jgi:hypothetical protein